MRDILANSISRLQWTKINKKAIQKGQYFHQVNHKIFFCICIWRKKNIREITTHISSKLSEMVFCYQNCFDLLWKRNVLVMKKTVETWSWRPRLCKIFEITRTIHSNSKRSEYFLVIECFFNSFLEVSHIS